MRRNACEVAHEVGPHAFQVLAVGKPAHELFDERLAVSGVCRLRCGLGCGGRLFGGGRGRFLGRCFLARARHLEPGGFEGGDHFLERYMLHLAAHVERHHAAHTFQAPRLGDLVEAERHHHIDDLGVGGHVVEHGFVEVDQLAHLRSFRIGRLLLRIALRLPFGWIFSGGLGASDRRPRLFCDRGKQVVDRPSRKRTDVRERHFAHHDFADGRLEHDELLVDVGHARSHEGVRRDKVCELGLGADFHRGPSFC